MSGLAGKTVLGLSQVIVALGVFLFAPAWTFDYWQAWVYLLLFAASAASITAYLWKNDPKLLERRVKGGPGAEKESSQRLIHLCLSIAFIALMIFPSLDHRFSWSKVPLVVVVAGDVLVACGFLIIFFVFRENTFTGSAIEVAADQQVIATGPYAIVRHPMYFGALVMLLGTSLALGSWWGVLMLLPLMAVIVWRLLNEERFLSKNLRGIRGVLPESPLSSPTGYLVRKPVPRRGREKARSRATDAQHLRH